MKTSTIIVLICNTYFDRKSKLQRHFGSEKHIRNVTPVNTYEMLVADFETFKNKFHELYQENQINKEKIKELSSKQDFLLEKNKDLCKELSSVRKQLSSVEKHIHSTPKTTVQGNFNGNVFNGNVTNINVHINPHGKENWDYISNENILKIMKGVRTCIPEMVKNIHFNKEHPENHNIVLPNKKYRKSKHIMEIIGKHTTNKTQLKHSSQIW